MTMTEAPPEVAAPDAAAVVARVAPEPPAVTIDTSDHKRIGLVFVGLAMVGFFISRGLGVTLGAELISRGVSVVGANGRRVWGLYDSALPMLFVGPLFVGIATAIVPLQIGASRLAYPRVQAFALWTHLVGAVLLVAGYIIDPPPGLGLSSVAPLLAPRGGVNKGTDLILTSYLVLGLATVVAAGNLVATCLTGRADGMTLTRMPLFSWSVLVAGIGTMLATPVFIASALVLYIDVHFGGQSMFASAGALSVWQKGLWLYGRPEIVLLCLPALGAAADIVVTTAKRPLLSLAAPAPAKLTGGLPPIPGVTTPVKGHVVAAGALGAVGVLSFACWTNGTKAMASGAQPLPTIAAAVVLVPIGIVATLWLGTLATAKARPSVNLLFVIGGLVALVVAVALGAWNVIDTAGVGTFAAFGPIEAGAIGVPTILGLGALAHWAPKLVGRKVMAPAAALSALAAVGGTLAVGLGAALAGHDGANAHLKDRAASTAAGSFVVYQFGQILLVAAGAILALDLARALIASRAGALDADLTDGITLEWAASSPPPLHNFDLIPEVRSEAPLLDLAASRLTPTQKSA